MQHRVYNLQGGVKILGLDVDDLAVIVLTWFLVFQLFGATLEPRVRFIVGFAATFLVYQVWTRTKDRVPTQFIKHFVSWLGERQQYEVTHDTEPSPYIIDVASVDELRRRQKRANTLVRRALKQRRKQHTAPPGGIPPRPEGRDAA